MAPVMIDRDRKINYNHDGHLAPKNDQQYKRKGERQEVYKRKIQKVYVLDVEEWGTGSILADHLSVWFSSIRHP